MRNVFINHQRRLFRMFTALLIACVINHYFAFSGQWWLPLAAIFVMLTDTGSAIYQGVLRYISLLVVVGASSWLFATIELMHVRIYDISLGAFIGIVVNSLIFPDRVDVVFRKSVVPILTDYSHYLQAIIHLMLTQQQTDADAKKFKVEKTLRRLPIWVYETGFDLALQKGYRYFVLKVTEIGEILFAMHHLARYPYTLASLEMLEVPLLECARTGEQFIKGLIDVLSFKKVPYDIVDFYPQIQLMENSLKQAIPLKLDVLDLSKEPVYLIEFIYNLRELQDVLIKMAESLRQAEQAQA